MKYSVLIFAAAALAAFSSCGRAVTASKDFKPNKPPVILSDPVITNADGSALDRSKLAPPMKVRVKIKAYDPEAGKLIYGHESQQGTFGEETVTDDGYSFIYTIASVAAGYHVKLNVTASDQKAASTTMTIDVGTGKTGPTISITPNLPSSINEDGASTSFTIAADCEGYYQAYCDNTLSSAPKSVKDSRGLYHFPYDPGKAENSVDVVVAGDLSPDASSASVILKTGGENKIWVYFQDLLLSYASDGYVLTMHSVSTADKTPPSAGTLVSAAAVDRNFARITWSSAADNVTAPADLRYYIVYSLADNMTDAALAMKNGTPVLSATKPAGIETSGTDLTFFAGGLSPDTDYYVTVIAEDEAGNRTAYPAKKMTTGSLFGGCGVDGPVYAVMSNSTAAYAGGQFSCVGMNAGYAALISRSTGQQSQTGAPFFDGEVCASAPDGNGGWYVGGAFTHVCGVPRGYFAHILPNGSLDAWNPAFDGAVYALVMKGNTLYVGGSFTSMGIESTVMRRHCAAFIPATETLTDFNPDVTGDVYAIAVTDSAVYIGGTFAVVGGAARYLLAALDPSTGALASWNAEVEGNAVYALAASPDGILCVGGNFTAIAGQSFPYLAAISQSDDAAAAGWDFSLNSTGAPSAPVRSIIINDQNIVFGGDSALVYVCDVSCTLKQAIPCSGPVRALAFSPDGTLVYAGGGFTAFGGQARNRLASFTASTGALRSWNPGVNDGVRTLSVSAGEVFAGGVFMLTNTAPRRNAAAFDADCGAVTAWSPLIGEKGSPEDRVLSITAPPPSVSVTGIASSDTVISGVFHSVNGMDATSDAIGGNLNVNGLAVIDADGALSMRYRYNFNGNSKTRVNGIGYYASGGVNYVLAAGEFDNEECRYYDGAVYAVRTGGEKRFCSQNDASIGFPGVILDSTHAASTDLTVAGGLSLISGNSSVYGVFQCSYSSTPVYIVNRFPQSFASATQPWSDGAVQALAQSSSGVLYVGGAFTSFCGSIRKRLAALDSSGELIPGWTPAVDDGAVNALAVDSATDPGHVYVYAGGSFTRVNAAVRKGLVRIRDGSLDDSWTADTEGTVDALAISADGKTLYVGGEFTAVAGLPRSRFAAIDLAAGTLK